MKLLDSTFLIDLLRGRKETLKIINSKEMLLTTQINIYEVVKGLFLKNIPSSKFAKIMEMFENIRVLPFDDNAVIQSAEIYTRLVKKGLEVHNFDCMIAGAALSRGVNTIITKNTRHFERINGMKVEKY
jgi:predicted nucleic acid-binding protein